LSALSLSILVNRLPDSIHWSITDMLIGFEFAIIGGPIGYCCACPSLGIFPHLALYACPLHARYLILTAICLCSLSYMARPLATLHGYPWLLEFTNHSLLAFFRLFLDLLLLLLSAWNILFLLHLPLYCFFQESGLLKSR